MTDQGRDQELERRLEQSIRLLQQVDDPLTRTKLYELKEALKIELGSKERLHPTRE